MHDLEYIDDRDVLKTLSGTCEVCNQTMTSHMWVELDRHGFVATCSNFHANPSVKYLFGFYSRYNYYQPKLTFIGFVYNNEDEDLIQLRAALFPNIIYFFADISPV